jgi:hypothetical protein
VQLCGWRRLWGGGDFTSVLWTRALLPAAHATSKSWLKPLACSQCPPIATSADGPWGHSSCLAVMAGGFQPGPRSSGLVPESWRWDAAMMSCDSPPPPPPPRVEPAATRDQPTPGLAWTCSGCLFEQTQIIRFYVSEYQKHLKVMWTQQAAYFSKQMDQWFISDPFRIYIYIHIYIYTYTYIYTHTYIYMYK